MGRVDGGQTVCRLRDLEGKKSELKDCVPLCPGFLPHFGEIWLESVAAGMRLDYQRTPLFESHLVHMTNYPADVPSYPAIIQSFEALDVPCGSR